MNILYPRIDWRGDGPGYAEMEFPLLPWTMAALYRIFGYQEVIGRILVYAFSLLTLLIFFLLARRLLPFWGSFAASLFFVLSPLAVRVSNSLQPESPMLFFYATAAYAFIRWLEEGLEIHDPGLPYLGMPYFDKIRPDHRFKDILRRVGLPTGDKERMGG